MFGKSAFVAALLCCTTVCLQSETVELRANAAVTGKILAEKTESVAVDVGYTVLVIPRSDIAAILRTDAKTETVPTVATTTPESAKTDAATVVPAFYRGLSVPGPSSNVRDLVKQIGEAVVLVRTR